MFFYFYYAELSVQAANWQLFTADCLNLFPTDSLTVPITDFFDFEKR